ncbi:MAG: hypothetical protein P4L97_15530 [Dyella sp.]|nr:hypothetical protein [Dyella sp.]
MSKSMLRVVPLCFLLTLLTPEAAPSTPSNAAKQASAEVQIGMMNERLNLSLKENEENRRTLAEQSATLVSLSSENVRGQERLSAQQIRLERSERQLAAMAAAERVTARRNDMATILNILGLIFGVLGGVLLAGAQLSARQDRITDIRVKKGFLDLDVQDPNRQMILNFFGLLGAISIAIGFVCQFFGALISAPLSWFLVGGFGLLALALVVWLSLYFLRYTPDQTSLEKIGVVVYNLRRHIGQPLWKMVSRQRVVTCQECLKAMTVEDANVWWVQERNIPSHPYLHSPNEFHYGHEACLTKVPRFSTYLNDPEEQDQVYKASARDFLSREVQQIRAWFEGHHRHWAERGKDFGKAPGEEQLDLVVKDISAFV